MMKKIYIYIFIPILFIFYGNIFLNALTVKEFKKKYKNQSIGYIDFRLSGLLNLVSPDAYISPYLLNTSNLYPEEIYKKEIEKISKLNKMTDNFYDNIFYLYQMAIIFYKNGDYNNYKILLDTIGKYIYSPKFFDFEKIVKERLDKYKIIYRFFKKQVTGKEQKSLEARYKYLISFLKENGFKQFFDFFLYRYKFAQAENLLKHIKPAYFENPDLYYNLQHRLDKFVYLWGDIQVEYPSFMESLGVGDKDINFDNIDVNWIIANWGLIKNKLIYYKNKHIRRVTDMKELLPYLYIIGEKDKFKNFYVKVIATTGEIPQNLILENKYVSFKPEQLRKIYKHALGKVINLAYRELMTNISLITAEEYLKEIKNFNPLNFIKQ